MLIGVMSDTHDNLPLTAKALDIFSERGVGMLIHSGDFVAPFTLKLILASGLPLQGVYGNNDGEKEGLAGLADTLCGGSKRIEVHGRVIVIAHDPQKLYAELSENDDIGICGHTHDPQLDPGPPFVLNPGEVGGWLTGRCTAAVLDTEQISAELIELGCQRQPAR